MAGNVTSGEGVEFLGDCGAKSLKLVKAQVQFAQQELLRVKLQMVLFMPHHARQIKGT